MLEVRERHGRGETDREIAMSYGVHPRTISFITTNQHWRHLLPLGTPEERRLRPRGEGHHKAKLTEEQVRDIRRRKAQGEGAGSVARVFGVSKRTVQMIMRGKLWKHVS